MNNPKKPLKILSYRFITHIFIKVFLHNVKETAKELSRMFLKSLKRRVNFLSIKVSVQYLLLGVQPNFASIESYPRFSTDAEP